MAVCDESRYMYGVRPLPAGKWPPKSSKQSFAANRVLVARYNMPLSRGRSSLIVAFKVVYYHHRTSRDTPVLVSSS